MKIGRNAIFGIGKPTDTIGSKNQRISGRRVIRIPSKTPPRPAIAKPASARYSVSPRLSASSPEAASSQTRVSTADKDGSRNGVTTPLREAASQATTSAKSEAIAPARRATAAKIRSRRSPAGAAAGSSRVLRLLIEPPPSLAPSHDAARQHQVEAVGGKAEQRHSQHHREHRVVGAAIAKPADHVAEPLPRDDQFGADQQYE